MSKLSRCLLISIVFFTTMPLMILAMSWLGSDYSSVSSNSDIWQHYLGRSFWQSHLMQWISNTLFLCVGVAFGVSFLGVLLAAAVSFYQFPGVKIFSWALMLPLAMPGYVMAFVYLGIFDYSGVVQSFLRESLGKTNFWFPEVRSGSSAVIVFSLVLYPYVYMLARASFLQQGQNTLQAAQSLGLSHVKAIIKVAIPICRPAIATGVALALMETLADFGTVKTFSFETFTTAIFKSWESFFNIQVAAQLASILLVFVLLALWLEQYSRQGASYRQQHLGSFRPIKPNKRTQLFLFTLCFSILSLAFLIPVAQLVAWIIELNIQQFDKRYFSWVTNTLFLGFSAATVTLLVAIFLAWIQRSQQKASLWIRLSTMGYALPGSILAIGIMGFFTYVDKLIAFVTGINGQQWFFGSLLALILAYVIRFNAVAFGPISASFSSIRPSIGEAGKLLGASPAQLARKVYLPLIRPGLLTAALLVFVDTMKEMPITLIMHPTGWDTLAVKIYGFTEEGDWQLAAIPALTLIISGLLPVIILVSKAKHKH